MCAVAGQLARLWSEVLGDRYVEIAYESFVQTPEESIRALIQFVDLPWHDDCLRFHESDRVASTLSNQQVRQPIHARSVGRAAAFGSHLDPLRRALQDAGLEDA